LALSQAIKFWQDITPDLCSARFMLHRLEKYVILLSVQLKL